MPRLAFAAVLMLAATGTSVAARPRPRVPGPAAPHYRISLWALLAIGVCGRLLLDLNTRGNLYDLDSLRIVAHALSIAPGHVYTLVDPLPRYRWPYPPGYFPLIALANGISGATGLHFERVIRFWPILADAGLALVVQDHLRATGRAGERGRLAAVALIMLAPSYAAISAVHGQIDQLAILPAVLALSIWERVAGPRRAPWAGALIGVGVAIKTVPGLVLLALLPSARSRRESGMLVGAAVAVVLLAIAPFVLHDGLHWFKNLEYNGGIGLGSLSLAVQPDLALDWLHVGASPFNSVSLFLFHHSRPVAIVAVLVVAAMLYRRRVPAPAAAILLWATVYAFGVTFFMQYMVWGLPFLLMAGLLWPAFVLEVVLVAPVLVIYRGVHSASGAWIFYVAPMLLVWGACTVLVLLWLAGRLRLSPRQTTRVSTAGTRG